MALTYHVTDDSGSVAVELEPERGGFGFKVGGQSGRADCELLTPDWFSLRLGNESYKVHFLESEGKIVLCIRGEYYEFEVLDAREKAMRDCQVLTGPSAGAGPRQIRSRIPGKVVTVLAAEGAIVAAGDKLLVVEAMKMENEIRSPGAGRVARVHVSPGQTVEAGSLLMELEPVSPPEGRS